MNNTTLKKFNLLDKNLVIKDTIVLYHKLKDKERIIDNLLTEDVFSKKNNILYLENINKISILDQVHSLNEKILQKWVWL